MIEDVFEGIFRMIGRFVVYFLFDILFEIVIKGTGHIIYKLFSDKDPDDLAVTILGIIFWLVLSALSYTFYSSL